MRFVPSRRERKVVGRYDLVKGPDHSISTRIEMSDAITE
jgi:hypothetical protein